ncbi:MAG TPA: hypothetical protein VFU05_19940, partial [Cyclobacteriaceae bacterium]|nr:hypothetical protein [Cyclobacteriaceae bacterium]
MARGRPKKEQKKKYEWFYSDYIADFENSDCEIIIDGYKILLPKPPADHLCLNYGKPIEEQKMPNLRIPKELFEWDAEEIEAYADNYYHKRKNGFWIFIKGQKLYITGLNFWHLSAWVMKNRKAPEYKYTDSKWFLCWMQCVRTPNCFGLVTIAARRDGKNERTLSMIAEYATRVSSVWCGMQSITERHVFDNSFSRITFCINLLHPLVKPINKGNTEGSTIIEFSYPVKQVSTKQLQDKQKKGELATMTTEEDYFYPALGSKIDYAPSRPSSYDGGRLERYLRDEFGKDEEANPYNTWMDHVREAMIDKTYGTIIGKAHFQTTTEEMGKIAQSMMWAKQIWDESDQGKPINEAGDTITGMHRIFRSAADTAQIDEWGFPLKEEKIREIVER